MRCMKFPGWNVVIHFEKIKTKSKQKKNRTDHQKTKPKEKKIVKWILPFQEITVNIKRK